MDRRRGGAALHVLGCQLLAAGAVGKVLDRASQAEQRQFVSVTDHWNDQAPVQRDRDAECADHGAFGDAAGGPSED